MIPIYIPSSSTANPGFNVMPAMYANNGQSVQMSNGQVLVIPSQNQQTQQVVALVQG